MGSARFQRTWVSKSNKEVSEMDDRLGAARVDTVGEEIGTGVYITTGWPETENSGRGFNK